MKSISLILIFLVTVAPLYAQQKPAVEQQQTGRTHDLQLKRQQQRLQDLDNQVTLRQQHIDNWYSSRIDDLYELSEQLAVKVDLTEGMIWTELFNLLDRQRPLYTDSYFLRPYYTPLLQVKTYEFTSAVKEGYILANVAALIRDRQVYDSIIAIAQNIYQHPLIRKKAHDLKVVMEKYHVKLTQLEKERKAEKNRLIQWQKDINEDIYRTVEQIESQPLTPQLGVVCAIIYEPEVPLCMIEGVEQILTNGEIINNEKIKNVKVVKISPNSVQFQKNGRKWSQIIGKKANSSWTAQQ
jgi:hypothetical protein